MKSSLLLSVFAGLSVLNCVAARIYSYDVVLVMGSHNWLPQEGKLIAVLDGLGFRHEVTLSTMTEMLHPNTRRTYMVTAPIHISRIQTVTLRWTSKTMSMFGGPIYVNRVVLEQSYNKDNRLIRSVQGFCATSRPKKISVGEYGRFPIYC